MRGPGAGDHSFHGILLAVDLDGPVLLVFRALGLGDFLTGVPAYRALAAAYPDHRLVLAAPAALRPLARLAGVVDGILPCAGLEPIGPRISPPAVAVNLHGKGPQSHRIVLATRPERFIAFAHPSLPETGGLPEWRADEHEVQRWCRLLREEGIECDRDRLELQPPDVRLDGFLQGATVIHPGAAKGARRWPVDRWAEVALKEVAKGRRVLVTGSSDERSLACNLAERAGLPAGSVLAGRTDLIQLAAVVSASARVLSADTGVAHLATAFGVPSVTLFGPTSPEAWGPPPDRRHHRCLWKGTVGDPLADRVDPGLLAIQVDEVLKALEDLPEAPATAAAGSVGPGR